MQFTAVGQQLWKKTEAYPKADSESTDYSRESPSRSESLFHKSAENEMELFHFANMPSALIGMESCPGSQWLARKLQASGTVRIVPAQFVKPDVKSNKNEMIDVAAVAEAVTRSTM
jgi:transposase